MDSYRQTLQWIYDLRGGEIDLRLDRMARALELFGNPEKQFRALHIAGTNGKGSTAALLHGTLSRAGYRVALYTSPHLVSFTERIRVGDREITPDEVVALAQEVRERISRADIPLTFFEFVTVMAFVYFARQGVDVAVVEVGLGGRLDATNLVQPLSCAITTIAIDHEAYLGADLLSIAREKAGIIKPGVPVVLGPLPQEARRLIKEIAEKQDAKTVIFGEDFKISLKNELFFDYTGIKHHFPGIHLGLRGRHQRNNAAVALAVLEIISEELPVPEDVIRGALASVAWPGRFEVMRENPTVILDGAHNREGIEALVGELERFRRGRKVRLLFAAMEDKDWRFMLHRLTEVAADVVLTRVAMARSADPSLLATALAGNIPNQIIDDPRLALQALMGRAHSDDIVVVAGSLYLLGEVRPLVQELAKAEIQ